MYQRLKALGNILEHQISHLKVSGRVHALAKQKTVFLWKFKWNFMTMSCFTAFDCTAVLSKRILPKK